jgi:hypothetical protein
VARARAPGFPLRGQVPTGVFYVTRKIILSFAFVRALAWGIEAVGYADAERVALVVLLKRHAGHEQSYDLLTRLEGLWRVFFDFG